VGLHRSRLFFADLLGAMTRIAYSMNALIEDERELLSRYPDFWCF